jgi:uncharacterized membrane protein
VLVLTYGLGIIVLIILLIYVIVNRIDEKNREEFEKRDN